MQEIVIFGTGDAAALACRYFEWDSPYRVAAFSADAAYIQSPDFMDRPVVAFEQVADFRDLRLDYTSTRLPAKRYFLPFREDLATFRTDGNDWQKHVDYNIDRPRVQPTVGADHRVFPAHAKCLPPQR